MFGGFYTVRYWVNASPGRSVMYAREGTMLGGNSAFAHIGTYTEANDEVTAKISTVRHNPDPNFRAAAGLDASTLITHGKPDGPRYRFEGWLEELPGSVFHSVLTPVDEEPMPVVGGVGRGGVVAGLYSLRLRTLDGVDAGLTGVMLLHDGRILGGDTYFYYVGSYTSAHGRWKGQILNQEHTPAKEQDPVFGGREVGIGFSGTCNDEGAMLEAVALSGKRSLRLWAELKLMRRA